MATGEAMRGMLWGGSVFLLLFALQVLAWRIFRPKRQMLALFLIYFGPVFGLAYFILPAGIFLFALSAAYVMTFPAIQAQSPTLLLIQEIKRRGGRVGEDDLGAIFNERLLLEERKKDLSRDGLVNADGSMGRFGKALAVVFLLYRRMLGISGGTG